MATSGVGALGGLSNANELKQRLLFVLGALLVFRIGTYIPVPGIDSIAFAQIFEEQEKTILGMFNMFSGGALERLSIFALGVMPYISASIIMQLMTAVIPTLEQMKKEGESGRRKISKYTRYGTVILATFQSVGIAVSLTGSAAGGRSVVLPGIGESQFIFIAAVTFVTGTIFLMWLGEQITERGIGNGISVLIFAGIVAGLPSAIGSTLGMASNDVLSPIMVLFLFVLAIGVTAFVVFVERGQRRITVKYAKRQQGRKLYAAQSSHLPLKLNMAGVIPPIFASAIILFPT
ncbi:MAG: preprotein translocase subunit SecY, partial [Methylococcales bacterium]|nr:preprotein translocase subunit SecY [Methylococcales bacterium]